MDHYFVADYAGVGCGDSSVDGDAGVANDGFACGCGALKPKVSAALAWVLGLVDANEVT